MLRWPWFAASCLGSRALWIGSLPAVPCQVYLGRQYRLKVEEGRPAPAQLVGRHLRVTVPDSGDTGKVRAAVEAWYRVRALEIFTRIASGCHDIAARHGVPPGEWSVRRMKRRWGSCSRAGRVILNTRLVQAPAPCIEYVIMHEFCHRSVHRHDAAFYALLTRCLPDWRRRRERLRRFVPA